MTTINPRSAEACVLRWRNDQNSLNREAKDYPPNSLARRVRLEKAWIYDKCASQLEKAIAENKVTP